jgi:hypothetical protein
MWVPWVVEQGQRDAENPDGPAIARMILAVVVLIGCVIALRCLTRRR